MIALDDEGERPNMGCGWAKSNGSPKRVSDEAGEGAVGVKKDPRFFASLRTTK